MEAPAQGGGPIRAERIGYRLGRRFSGAYKIIRKAVSDTLADGYIHAGNIAYLSLVTLLPLVILLTAVTGAFGETEAGRAVISGFLESLPDDVAKLYRPVIDEVLDARTGRLLWVGALVALWTVATFIETMRDIVHRAYGITLHRRFVEHRLQSIFGTLVAMVLVVFLFIAHVSFIVLVNALTHLIPVGFHLPGWIDWSKAIPPAIVFLSLWALYKMLSPRAWRRAAAWPGAIVTTIGWFGSALLIGRFYSGMGHVSLTYGALSGVMVALLFFYVIGFSIVLGAELNAALAQRSAAE